MLSEERSYWLFKDSSLVKWPPRLRGDPATRNPNVYCHFHQDHGHNIENCKNLHDEIEELIRREYLKNYILREERGQADRQGNQRRNASETNRQNEQPPRQLPKERLVHGVINMITSGSIIVGCTSAAGRTSVRELENEGENLPKRPRLEEPIYFAEDDARGIQYSYDDYLVVKLRINDFEVKRILVDAGNSADIPFKETFNNLQLQQSDLKLVDTPLIGFSGEEVRPLGRVTVPMEAGTWPNIIRFEHTFLVVTTPSPYNAIVGKPITHVLHAIVSTYYLAMKFPTDYGVGVVRGDQLESRKCYVAASKGKAKMAKDVELKQPAEYTDEQAAPKEETVHISISATEPARTL
ncbi:PREDICTED: uncharacterized protein LOC104600421 [Nelumbo nucifera]|uniref:Uncharacterized protein LOC104600421 n=1 Tax=Nelumbo nucifera TaxID=4432 RepID=A0A1U8AGV7_NELNU|nr:PREDICTED: uncharacterized protein LOC104600421 [Nelumbo nucifera]